MRLLRYFTSLVICLSLGELLLTACHQDPQPVTPPTFTFSRSFDNVLANQTLKSNYPTDSLTYSITRFHKNLRIELAPKKQHQGNDAIIIRLDSAALFSGLVGNYVLPQLDTVSYTQHPSSLLVFYMYTTTYNASQHVAQSQNLYNFLPGSYLSLTNYDPDRQTISGRFEFQFPSWNPNATPYLINRNWKATVQGEFTNLPIEQ